MTVFAFLGPKVPLQMPEDRVVTYFAANGGRSSPGYYTVPLQGTKTIGPD